MNIKTGLLHYNPGLHHFMSLGGSGSKSNGDRIKNKIKVKKQSSMCRINRKTMSFGLCLVW